MKKSLIITAILLLPILNSCLDDLTTFPVDGRTIYYLYLNINETDPLSINEPIYVMVDEPDILDNLAKIDDWKINEITYMVVLYIGSPDIVFNGTLTLGSVSMAVSNLNLNDMYVNGTNSTLTLTDQQLKTLASDFRSDGTIEGSISGDVSGKPLQAQIEMIFDMEVKVKK